MKVKYTILKNGFLLLILFLPLLTIAQEISCEELKNIKITESNRNSVIKKYNNQILKCSEMSKEDSIALLSGFDLITIAKYGPESNQPSSTIGNLITELKLMRQNPEYESLRELAVFVHTKSNEIIKQEDKELYRNALMLYAMTNDSKIDPKKLIDYIFSNSCRGLTYTLGIQKFHKMNKFR